MSLFILVRVLCREIEQYKPLIALRLEGNTINEVAATAIGQALEKHSEIEVDTYQSSSTMTYSTCMLFA
jgi:hypothetical protein